jgi:hypothetical protein
MAFHPSGQLLQSPPTKKQKKLRRRLAHARHASGARQRKGPLRNQLAGRYKVAPLQQWFD